MAIRTGTTIVTFTRSFRLSGFDGEQPAGSYTVETDEELLEPLSFAAYRRIATWIRVPLRSGAVGSQTIPIDPGELEAALARDAAPEG
jgi:hypothetical protein